MCPFINKLLIKYIEQNRINVTTETFLNKLKKNISTRTGKDQLDKSKILSIILPRSGLKGNTVPQQAQLQVDCQQIARSSGAADCQFVD